MQSNRAGDGSVSKQSETKQESEAFQEAPDDVASASVAFVPAIPKSSVARMRVAPRIGRSPEVDSYGELEPTLRVPDLLTGGGQQLAGYDVGFELASGGLGTIHLGIQRGIEGFEKLVAIKTLRRDRSDNEQYVAMLIDEACISAQATHPYVRDVFDLGRTDDGRYYIVMEFLQGEPLFSVWKMLRTRDPATFPEHHDAVVATVIARLCEGLHAVHEITSASGDSLQVVHRDITPQNLYVLHDGTVRLTDFGIVHANERRQRTDQRGLKGKVAYMSPEYLAGTALNRRSDVWAMGVVFWEMLTGERLFRKESEAETMLAVCSMTVPKPSSVRAGIDPELDRIALQALARNAEERFESAQAFARELDRWLLRRGELVTAEQVGGWLRELLPDSLSALNEIMALARRLPDAKAPDDVAPGSIQPKSLPPTRVSVQVQGPIGSSAIQRASPQSLLLMGVLLGVFLAALFVVAFIRM
jgi:serine/threonine-protein kinase